LLPIVGTGHAEDCTRSDIADGRRGDFAVAVVGGACAFAGHHRCT
jgi:hypothetical protein